jgi:pyridoxal phosphate enzyme (YggS family)
MVDIALNISILKQQIPTSVKIVAVSKTKPVSDIMVAYQNGHKCFGENRVQELISKKDLLPSDIEWHLIGHLQSNKVKYIVPFISLIESVDSFNLLKIIDSEAEKTGRIVKCLLQIHIAKEETKYGFSIDEVNNMLESIDFRNLRNIVICGVMGMATLTDNMNTVRSEFRYLKNCFLTLKEIFFSDHPHFTEISMGMSGDYRIAVEEGSTIVRIGSSIFGERN